MYEFWLHFGRLCVGGGVIFIVAKGQSLKVLLTNDRGLVGDRPTDAILLMSYWVDSANKHGILLDMVHILIDLDLVISKSYICSDGGWFMDVFHVTDRLGNKLMDKSPLNTSSRNPV